MRSHHLLADARSFLLAPLLVLLTACCTAPPAPAAATQADLPEVGEVWPRRTH